jgi:hypothetical protein
MIDVDGLRKQVEMLSDEALLEVQREDLVDAALAVYNAEVESRGLAWPDATGISGEEAAPADPEGDLVSIAKYESAEEARFARTLLINEGIPVWYAGELSPDKMSGDPKAGLELITKTDFLEQAQLVLSTEVSDEELARQAEEAGEEEEEVEEEEKEE